MAGSATGVEMGSFHRQNDQSTENNEILTKWEGVGRKLRLNAHRYVRPPFYLHRQLRKTIFRT
jgi:hypothetical protein